MFKFLRKTSLYILATPALFILLGTASNQLVLYANGDRFPVSVNIVKAHEMAPYAVQLPDGSVMLDDVHVVASKSTHLNLLADVFDLPSGIESIGDLSLELGAWLWTFAPFVYITLVTTKLLEDNR